MHGAVGHGELLSPLMEHAATGRPRVPDPQIGRGQSARSGTGTSWRDLPESYGARKAVRTRLRRYCRDGG
ncbi:transposase [[Kitasatospora] papulosa]|uniref:transposase n=1 Tax=[Kitasatospora] papulosa TaxID=1464011 RepID=UPI00367DA541